MQIHNKGAGSGIKGRAAGKVAYCVARKGKTDYCNGGADDNGGHDLVYPFYAGDFNRNGYNHIYKAGKGCADNKAEETQLH